MTRPENEASSQDEQADPNTPDRIELLRIYLADHHAGSVGGAALAERIVRQGGPMGLALSGLVDHIEEDRRRLLHLMGAIGARRHRSKELAATVAERLGRLKLNGRLVGKSPLTPLLELEAMSLAVEGRKRLWLTMTQLAETSYPDWDMADLRLRARRADEDVDAIDALRLEAAVAALG